jgi:hypothetical protein
VEFCRFVWGDPFFGPIGPLGGGSPWAGPHPARAEPGIQPPLGPPSEAPALQGIPRSELWTPGAGRLRQICLVTLCVWPVFRPELAPGACPPSRLGRCSVDPRELDWEIDPKALKSPQRDPPNKNYKIPPSTHAAPPKTALTLPRPPSKRCLTRIPKSYYLDSEQETKPGF